ncbi:hypothetical protein ANN_18609 [Periplaneta americana]|uniref:Uncharacterized protein n=1 Tax=Periplaneta americana TaxID=6978 RepID=A0ABQ8SP82_PERAM|nr:hypothetical protein ANN_18609 [Periplaneta americana]
MSPGSSTESYPAFAHIGLRENPGKNLKQMSPNGVYYKRYIQSITRALDHTKIYLSIRRIFNILENHQILSRDMFQFRTKGTKSAIHL